MVSNEKLIEYYEAHKDEFPVYFCIFDRGIAMQEDEDGPIMATLEDNFYEVFPSIEVPYAFMNDLRENSKRYNYNLDEEDPQSVLTAFVDCTYLSLFALRKEVDRLMSIIERGDTEE